VIAYILTNINYIGLCQAASLFVRGGEGLSSPLACGAGPSSQLVGAGGGPSLKMVGGGGWCSPFMGWGAPCGCWCWAVLAVGRGRWWVVFAVGMGSW